jgi:DNA gyrase subunit B
MDPDSRNLKQVNIEDGRLANEVTEVLMGSDVEPRRAFIVAHAREAEIDT